MLLELFKISFESVFKNKLRSFLTMLGIIIGIMVIILMQAAISGFQNQVQQEIDNMGSNSFVISKFPVMNSGNDWRKYWNRKDILASYTTEITKSCPHVAQALLIQRKWGQTLKYNHLKTEENIGIHGASFGFNKIMNYEISKGRNFVPYDYENGSNSIIIGETVRRKLFNQDNPLGKTILLRGRKFTVIGVYGAKGQQMGEDRDAFAVIPSQIFQKLYGKNRRSNRLIVSAKSQKDVSRALDEVIVTLRRIRKLKPGTDNDFELITKDVLNEKLGSIISMIYLAAFSIGGMSIVVGSIGIMNIMLVSITERTREIGIRRSIGASGNHVRIQFLTEAVILSFLGGALGILTGSTLSEVIENFTGWIINIEPLVILFAFGFSALIGIVAGFYPAYKASKLNPIDCLRYE